MLFNSEPSPTNPLPYKYSTGLLTVTSYAIDEDDLYGEPYYSPAVKLPYKRINNKLLVLDLQEEFIPAVPCMNKIKFSQKHWKRTIMRYKTFLPKMTFDGEPVDVQLMSCVIVLELCLHKVKDGLENSRITTDVAPHSSIRKILEFCTELFYKTKNNRYLITDDIYHFDFEEILYSKLEQDCLTYISQYLDRD